MINRRLPNLIVPKDKESEQSIYTANPNSDNFLTWPVSREDLNELFETGLFDKLNNEFVKNISEYEEDEITTEEQFQFTEKCIDEILSKKHSPAATIHFQQLLWLIGESRKYNTCVFFFF